MAEFVLSFAQFLFFRQLIVHKPHCPINFSLRASLLHDAVNLTRFFTQSLSIVVALELNHFELKFFELFICYSHCLQVTHLREQTLLLRISYSNSISNSFCHFPTVFKFASLIFDGFFLNDNGLSINLFSLFQ